MKKLIRYVLFWAAAMAGFFVAGISIAVLKPTLTVWVILLVASLTAVLGIGVYLHVIRKRPTKGFALPGDILPGARREWLPILIGMIGLLLAAALMATLPMIINANDGVVRTR